MISASHSTSAFGSFPQALIDDRLQLLAAYHDAIPLWNGPQTSMATATYGKVPCMIGCNTCSLSPCNMPLIGRSFCSLSRRGSAPRKPPDHCAHRPTTMSRLSDRPQWLSTASLAIAPPLPVTSNRRVPLGLRHLPLGVVSMLNVVP